MSVINTNITSMIGQQNLNKSQNALQTSMERLSSGLRINSAKDDAAGQAISNRMTSQINGLAQAQRNANDGISIAQTAEGGLNQINDNLQRVRELTVQAQNGTNSASDIDSIQQEVNQRLEEIDRIARETDFNGTNVLNVDSETSIQIQVGSEDGQTINVTINAQSGWNQFASNGEEGFIAAGALAQVGGNDRQVDVRGFDVLDRGLTEATIDVDNISGISGIGDGFDATIVRNDANQAFIQNEAVYSAEAGDQVLSNAGDAAIDNVVRDGDGNLFLEVSNATPAGAGQPAAGFYAIDASNINADGGITFDFDGANPVSTPPTGTEVIADGEALITEFFAIDNSMVEGGVVTADISTLTAETGEVTLGTPAAGEVALNVTGGSAALSQLDDALAAVDVQRSELGAIQNRFEDAISNLSTNETNLAAARSRIEDADYAMEVADMTRAQILQQAGTSVLAQANQIPQNVLSLLG